MIPWKYRLRNLCVKVFCWSRSQKRGASSRAVWSQLTPRQEITKAKCPGWATALRLPAPNSSMAQKEIVMVPWLPCPVPPQLSPAHLFSSISPQHWQCQHFILSRAASPKGTEQGKEWKGTKVLKSGNFPGKADLNPNAIYGNCTGNCTTLQSFH